MNKPSAYYQLVPRMSYLPFYLQDVRDHFAPSVPQLGNDAKMWLSYRNVPVKWQLPAGVIYDIIKQGVEEQGTKLIQLTVHFEGFPEDQILQLQHEDELRFFFNHSLKEAACIKFGSAKSIITLSTSDQQDLCEAVRDCHSRFSNYQKIREKIERHAEGQSDKLPVRLFVGTAQDPLDKYKMLLRAARQDLTFGQLLHFVLPKHFPEQHNQSSPMAEAKALLHGVSPLVSCPLKFVAENASNPDFWINIVVVLPRETNA